MIEPDDIQPGDSYADARGIVRRCDAREPGRILYTIAANPERPAQVGKSFVSGPGWFAAQAVRSLPSADGQETLFTLEGEVTA